MAENKYSKQELEQLGQTLVTLYETGYITNRRFYKMSFVKGLLVGFGTVLGATLLIGFLLWGLSFFESVPWIGEISNNITKTIESSK